MTTRAGDRWDDAGRLFDEALERTLNERAAWLDGACGGNAALRAQVEALLVADAAAGRFLEVGALQCAVALLDNVDAPPLGDSRPIGPYRLTRELARGGMGVVYLAERSDGQFQQRVALKLIKRGMDSDEIHRRFLSERQILARLHHPHIASLLDGGVSAEGQPWFAIEYVDGSAIIAHCDARQLDTESRLRLFLDVCDAVRYAHQNLVVHRDIKPSNILVTDDGEVKLLDFGIAKLLGQDGDGETKLTETGVRVMTPEYAAPEQVSGAPVTTATDVYALGAVLYELLTGRRAHQIESHAASEVERVVCREEPVAPSLAAAGPVQKHLRGDLDTIVLTALQKEPDRRYPTVEQLASDVRRHLAGMPVTARPDTWRYRATKFVRRHRLGVAAAAAVVFSLVAGLAGTIWQARVAAERARLAAAEAAKQRAVRDVLVQLFQGSDPSEARGRELTARELLGRGRQSIDTALAGQPAVRAELLTVLGIVHRSLGDLAPADTLFSQAVALSRTLGPPARPELATRLAEWASNLMQQDQYDRADSLLQEALSLVRANGGDSATLALPLRTLSLVQANKGNGVLAATLARQALSIDRQHSGDGTTEVADDLSGLANALAVTRDYAGADSAASAALAIRRRLLQPDHPALLTAISDAGVIKGERGNFAGADTLLREVLAGRRRIYPDGHHEIAEATQNLGYYVEKEGRVTEAESLYVQALELYRSALGPDHTSVAQTLSDLAGLRYERGELKLAERDMRESVTLYRRILGAEHPQTLWAIDQLGIFLRELGRYQEAEALMIESLTGRIKVLGDTGLDVSRTLASLGDVKHRMGQNAEAEKLLQQSLAIQRANLPPGDFAGAHPMTVLGEVLCDLGRPKEAELQLRPALELRTAGLGPTHYKTSATRRDLGYALALQDRYDEAERLLLQAYRDLGQKADYWSAREERETLRRMVEVYSREGRPAEAARYRRLMARARSPG